MSTGRETFNCLLELKEIFNLYIKIGTVLKTQRDLNDGVQNTAYINSIYLLLNTKIIGKRKESYYKVLNCNSFSDFTKNLMDRIFNSYTGPVSSIVNCNKHYDESRNKFYFFLNEVPLRLAGLQMLMEQAGEFEKMGNRLYFNNISNYNGLINSERKMSLEELYGQLQRNEELGEEAEKFVIMYEKQKLRNIGINKDPIQVSIIDVLAGYDIASYISDSDKPNKYIEVKSCDEKYSFHISRNEIEKAREKRDAYYLYLYIRTQKRVVEVQNPYFTIFKSGTEWNYESESFIVSKY